MKKIIVLVVFLLTILGNAFGIDLSGYRAINEVKGEHTKKILEKNGKYYLWIQGDRGLKVNGKSDIDRIGEIPTTNGKKVKFLSKYKNYLIDSDYLYNPIISFTDQNFNFEKKSIGDMDYNTIEYLGGQYYKDKNSVYLIYTKFGEINVKKIDNVDLSTFKIINLDGRAEDKNNYYIVDSFGNLTIEKKKDLIKKEDIELNDFSIIGKFNKGYLNLNITTKIYGDFNIYLKNKLTPYDIRYSIITNGEGKIGTIGKKYLLDNIYYVQIYKKNGTFKLEYIGTFIIDVVNDNGNPKILIKKIYIDTTLKDEYVFLIKNKYGERIKKISYKKRKYVAGKVDKLLDKIANNSEYNNDKKIKKSSLFAAFRDVLLEK